MNEVETKLIKLSQLEQNKGQVEGLPKNPRFIRDAKYEKLKKSIVENPEMLSLRELLVFPLTDNKATKYVVIGGNMRFRAMQDLGHTEAPCKIIPHNTPVASLKAYTIKDNGAYGQWDYDSLADEWDDVVDLEAFGVEISAWKVREQDFDTSAELDLDSFDEEMKLTIKMSAETLAECKERLAKVNSSPEMALLIVSGWNDGE